MPRKYTREYDGNNHIWLTREGVRVPVAEMTDAHLINAARFVLVGTLWAEIFSAEADARELENSVVFCDDHLDEEIPF